MLKFTRITKGILFLTLFLAGFPGFSQQMGQYSQYMMNYFLINPAVAGTEDFTDIRMGYRMQWTGLQGAPRNYYVSVHAPLDKTMTRRRPGKKAKPHHTIGGYAAGQTLGLLSHNSAYATYAYHLPLSSEWTMSMGAIAGINQFALDKNSADFGDGTSYDPALQAKSQAKFDVGVGIWLYSSKFFGGLSSIQIAQNKIDFAQSVPGSGMLSRHYYLTAGYKWRIDELWTVVPSFLVKGTVEAFQVDINTKVRFKDRFWAGASYRRSDAVAFLGGISVPLSDRRHNQRHGNNVMLDIGYSYDLTTSRLNKYSYGSHEIMIGIRIPTFGRILNPQDFW